MIRDEQQKVFFFAKQGENYIPLRFKRSEQQRSRPKSRDLVIIYHSVIHRYYFGKTGSAVVMTLIFWTTIWFLGFGLIIVGIWALLDVFRIPSWLKADQKEKEQAAIQEILMRRDSQNTSDGYSSLHDDEDVNVENVPDSEVSLEESK